MKKYLNDPILCSTLVTVVAFAPMVYNKHNNGSGLKFSDALIILVFYIFMNWIFEEVSENNKEQ